MRQWTKASTSLSGPIQDGRSGEGEVPDHRNRGLNAALNLHHERGVAGLIVYVTTAHYASDNDTYRCRGGGARPVPGPEAPASLRGGSPTGMSWAAHRIGARPGP